jgi:hypothetical protein
VAGLLAEARRPWVGQRDDSKGALIERARGRGWVLGWGDRLLQSRPVARLLRAARDRRWLRGCRGVHSTRGSRRPLLNEMGMTMDTSIAAV